MIIDDFETLDELYAAFPDEESCIEHLERLRWGGRVVSPFDPSSKVYRCRNHRWRCKNTGKYFNVKTHTLFDGTKLPLRKWFAAIWLVTCQKKSISSYQLAREIGITQKSAYNMKKGIIASQEWARQKNGFPQDLMDRSGKRICEDDVIFDGENYFRVFWNDPTNEVAAFSTTYGYLEDTSKENLSRLERIGTFDECEHLMEND